MPMKNTRIEVYDPNIPDKPIAVLTVPGEVTTLDIRKKLKVSVAVVVRKGNVKKRKSFALDIQDDELKERLSKYIDNLRIKTVVMNITEKPGEEKKMADIMLEE